MKRYILVLNFLIFFATVNAQTNVISFDVNGLKVILKQTQKETVSICMFYRGGVMNYKPEQAGIENMALSAAAVCGTKNYSVTDYQELADEYGIRISGASTTDFGIISMNCIAKYLDQGWKLFADAIVNPAFDKAEYQVTKDKMISAISHSQSDPETRVEQLTMENMFKGTQYSVNPLGTISSVNGFTADSVSNYYHKQLLNKNKMFLVVAGNITQDQLEKKINAAFGKLIAKPYTRVIYEQKPLKGEVIVVEQRNIATNYMSCIMNAPVMSNPDYYPFILVINALSGSLNYEIRTKQGLSYDPGAKVKMQQVPYTTMFVSTTQPKKAYSAMNEVYNNIKNGQYSQRYLDALKKDHRDKFYRHQESANAIVADLGKAEILGDYRMEENIVENLNKVTLERMKFAFEKYLNGRIWIYLGDGELIKE